MHACQCGVTVVVLKPDFVPSSVGRRQCPETPQKQSPGTHLHNELKGPRISDINKYDGIAIMGTFN